MGCSKLCSARVLAAEAMAYRCFLVCCTIENSSVYRSWHRNISTATLFNTIQRQSDAEKVSEVEQELKAAVKESEVKFAQLKREEAAAQAEFIEVMEQAEAEFDDNSDRLKQELSLIHI